MAKKLTKGKKTTMSKKTAKTKRESKSEPKKSSNKSTTNKPMSQGQETLFLGRQNHRISVDTNVRVQRIEKNTQPKGYLVVFDFTFALISVLLAQALISLKTPISIVGLWLFIAGLIVFLLTILPQFNFESFRRILAFIQIGLSIIALILYLLSSLYYLGV